MGIRTVGEVDEACGLCTDMTDAILITNWDDLDFASEVIVALDEEIASAEVKDQWEDQDNRRDHLRAYKRMRRAISNWLGKDD